MKWDMENLRLEFSESLFQSNLGKYVVQSFNCNEIVNTNNHKDEHNIFQENQYNNLDEFFSKYIKEEKIPYCQITPKFEYDSHIDKIRNSNEIEMDFTCNRNKISMIKVLFVTIEIYDEVISEKNCFLSNFFGHEVIDLVFNEAKNHSREHTRCIVVWIGTRDCLSQESLLNTETYDITIQKSLENDINKKKKFIDQTCLDKCIVSLLINYSIDSIEVKNELEASQYLFSMISSISEFKKKPISSKYKPRINSGLNESLWITQLMQIPGLSDDSARAIESIYKTPKDLITFIKTNINKENHKNNSNFIASNYSNDIFKNELQDSEWFNKLSNISFLCSKSLNIRKLGKALAKKLVLLYSDLSVPTKTLTESNFL